MMLGEESDAATYWKQCGDAALANGVKGNSHDGRTLGRFE